ncbi:HesB/IscA family protein [Mariluticola halotolerans]|uniref:HesB/IscA family protein n=1 Tax=Mariluticola halotolerans TaxID=2909283 RepID=UPI0026E456C2|nr:iron-sulfur cluster assembly accessory protein [Mariluticola halotolerans]UJQ94911.1 iron-sulfur cluster assembly accessory protein [Mariluticola halotolerans]
MSFEVIKLTESAAERISEIMENSDTPVTGVRVGVKNSGCAGVAYTLDYVAEPVEGDDHVHQHGVDVYIDPKATMFLLGTVMDFEVGKLSSSFTFTNPNQVGACGCGESVQLEKADLRQLAEARAAG